MTVCTAVIAKTEHGPVVFGVTDRMLTGGSSTFEPDRPKIIWVTSAIAILTAGDISVQDEVCQNTISDVREILSVDEDTWLTVETVSDIYRSHHDALRQKSAEQEILTPLGMSLSTFASSGTSSELIRSLALDLTQFQLDTTETIIMGLDPTGAHIYRFYNGTRYLCDSVGFAAVGSGGRHADSQFMASGYTPTTPVEQAILVSLLAKRRAENAPGVGQATDAISIGPHLGVTSLLKNEHLAPVMEICDEIIKDEREALMKGHATIAGFITALGNAPSDPNQNAPGVE